MEQVQFPTNTIPPVENLSDILPTKDKALFNSLYVLSHLVGQNRVDKYLAPLKKHYNQSISETIKKHRNAEKGKMFAVPEVADITPNEMFLNHTKPGVPLVIKGKAKNWKAVKEWDLEFFKKHYGSDPALLLDSKNIGGIDKDDSYDNSTLGEVIDNIRAKGDKYARFHPLLDRHPELLNDFDMDWINQHMVGQSANGKPFHNIFIGGEGNFTASHAARSENLFVQVEGQKRWTLWPSDYNYLCDSDSNRAIYKTSRLDPYKPDLSKFPAYEFADFYETVLDPGDILYIPGYTWHHVTNLSDSIGCGMRWMSPETSFKADPLKAVMAVLSTNPSIFKYKEFLEADGVFDFNRVLASGLSRKKA